MVSLAEAAIMCIVLHVWHDERKIRKLTIGQIGGKLTEGNQIPQLVWAIHYIGKVGERIVVFHVGISIAASVADGGQILSVGLPSFARAQEMTNEIVGTDRTGEAVMVGDDLASREHEVVADGRMSVCKVLGSQSVLVCQTFEVGHGRAADYTCVAVIFFHDKENMAGYRHIR